MEQRRQDIKDQYPIVGHSAQAVQSSPQLPCNASHAVAVTTVVKQPDQNSGDRIRIGLPYQNRIITVRVDRQKDAG